MFCRFYAKKERKQVENNKKNGGKYSSSCCDTVFVCRDTKFRQAKGTILQPATKCRNKAQTELNG